MAFLLRPSGTPQKFLSDEAANDLRLFANDAIEQLRIWRKRGQLEILQIQIGTALKRLDARDAQSSHHQLQRSNREQRWIERGAK